MDRERGNISVSPNKDPEQEKRYRHETQTGRRLLLYYLPSDPAGAIPGPHDEMLHLSSLSRCHGWVSSPVLKLLSFIIAHK